LEQSPREDAEDESRNGLIAGVIAFSMWGVFPIYFKLVDSVSSFEILLHRIVWAVPFGALVLLFRHQWPEVRLAFADRRKLLWLGLAALCISANWFIYIWAVQHGRIFEASLGYYINPLMYVLVGVFFFAEKLRPLQIAAIAAAFVGIMVLTVKGGVFPWSSLGLAVLFTAYGVIRKQVPVGAMPGLFVETILLFPVAFAALVWMMLAGRSAFDGGDITLMTLLLLAGPFTVLPLLFFAVAARRVSLTTLGFMQFIGPSLQFVVGVYYGEQLTTAHIICFGLIWTAVLIFSADAIRASKKPLHAKPAGV
jgi:chloramphenicol-sensitive protein RarD